MDRAVSRAIEYACDFLWIDIESIEVRFTALPLGAYGFAYEENEDEYVVEISSRLNLKDRLVTLFHELVHVRQFMLGHLLYKGEKLCWKGSDYSVEEPWEYEAYKYEKIMYEQFISTFNSVERV